MPPPTLPYKRPFYKLTLDPQEIEVGTGVCALLIGIATEVRLSGEQHRVPDVLTRVLLTCAMMGDDVGPQGSLMHVCMRQ